MSSKKDFDTLKQYNKNDYSDVYDFINNIIIDKEIIYDRLEETSYYNKIMHDDLITSIHAVVEPNDLYKYMIQLYTTSFYKLYNMYINNDVKNLDIKINELDLHQLNSEILPDIATSFIKGLNLSLKHWLPLNKYIVNLLLSLNNKYPSLKIDKLDYIRKHVHMFTPEAVLCYNNFIKGQDERACTYKPRKIEKIKKLYIYVLYKLYDAVALTFDEMYKLVEPTKHPYITYRIVNDATDHIDCTENKILSINELFGIDKLYSTTRSIRFIIDQDFIKEKNNLIRSLFIIILPIGTKILYLQPYSSVPSEEEILINRKHHMLCKKKDVNRTFVSMTYDRHYFLNYFYFVTINHTPVYKYLLVH